MSQIKAEGYTFDVGPTIVMMPDLYCSLFELAGKNPEDYFHLKRLEPMYDAYFKAEIYRKYTITSDLVELMKMNEGIGSRDSFRIFFNISVKCISVIKLP